MTREEFETALDAGKFQVLMGNGNWWTARRNGKTQVWKRDPNRFRTPIKLGLKTCDEITVDKLAQYYPTYLRVQE